MVELESANKNMQPESKRVRNTIIGLIVIIAIVILILMPSKLHTNQNYTITSTVSLVTTSTSTNTSSLTTTAERLNFSENTTLNTLAINKSNVLFGIPDQSQFEQMYYNVTPPVEYQSIYGLNFTAPIMTGTQETNITYSPIIPTAYLNITYPAALYIIIITYHNASQALNSYNNESFSPSYPSPFTNGTYYVNASDHLFKNASKAHVLEVNITRYSPNIGNTSTALDFNSIYHLNYYQVDFVYGRDLVILNTYGITGKYNYAYANNIAKHIYNLLANTTQLP